MSDEIHCVRYNNGKLRLDIQYFGGDDYEKASVKFKLVGDQTGHGVIDESPAIPVKALFDITFLIGMCIRRTAAQYELEVQEMVDKIELKKHPFKNIGGIYGKKDKEK